MQKIIIKNFGPIQEAEIELKKVLVLIGEQASGKSTIARLIYFFKTLRQDFFLQIYKNQKSVFDKKEDFITPIETKFYDFFGSPIHFQSFWIKYYYNIQNNKYIELHFGENKKLNIQISSNFFTTETISIINKQFNEKNSAAVIEDEIVQVNHLNNSIEITDKIFENKHINSMFVIAGRNTTVNYSELFEKYLFAHVQSKIAENSHKSLAEKSQTIEETLMLSFIKYIETIKQFFKKYGGFDGIIENVVTNKKQTLVFLKNKIEKILKAEYKLDNSGEKLVLNEKKAVYLSQASSGQQEVIRILQDIFLITLQDSKALRIIEEPEAHLFPVAQKHLIELLAYMVNHDEDNQLIITTHSPYMLTIFNNLLFANRVVEKNAVAENEVNEIIEKAFWLKASDFSAYSLGNSSFGEDAAYCESIFNEKTGMIQQNYLDEVSEMLGSDFQALMNIHAKTFAR